MTKKSHRKILGGEWENFGWRMGNFLVEKHYREGDCLRKGRRKFDVPGNVILQKSPDAVSHLNVVYL